MKSVRRIVTLDDTEGRSRAIADGPAPAVQVEPGTGVASTLLWFTDRTPARIDTSPLHAPYRETPPPGGSVCRIVRFPPEMGSFMERERQTLDFCLVLEGERVLLLDDGERAMRPGDVVVQLGNWHGWTNPRGPSLMAFIMMGAEEKPK